MRSRWENFGGRLGGNESLPCSSNGDGETSDPSQERLLHLYDALREEIVQHQRAQERRTIRGTVAVGAILGYAASTGVNFVIGFVPIIIGYLLVESIETHMDIGAIGKYVARIERELSEPGSPFRYEIKYGVGSAEREHFVGLRFVPPASKVSFALVAYVGSIVFVSEVVWPSGGVAVGELLLTKTTLWYGYLLLTVLLLPSVLAFLYNSKRIQNEVGEWRN